MTEQHKESFQQQAEQNIESAALLVARSIQTPGQTKEQTKLIAQGIAKGIALYKRQQNEKLREREKLRKKLQRQRVHHTEGAAPLTVGAGEGNVTNPARAACWTAGTVFAIASILHIVRWFLALPITLGTWTVPVWWSLPAAGLTGLLGAWLFLTGRNLPRCRPPTPMADTQVP